MAPGRPAALVRLFLVLLFQVNLCMSLSLVTPGKFPSTKLAGEGFLTRVRADVCGEVVAPAEGPHAYSALEGLVTRVDAEVTRELI